MVPCTHGICRLLYCYMCYQLATVIHRKTYKYLQCDNVGRSDCLWITRQCNNSSSDLSHSVIMSRFVIQILGFCQRGSFVHHFPPRGSVMGCDLMWRVFFGPSCRLPVFLSIPLRHYRHPWLFFCPDNPIPSSVTLLTVHFFLFPRLYIFSIISFYFISDIGWRSIPAH